MNNHWHRGAGEKYLQQYPKLEKWMNQCISCQHRGHKPDMPDPIKPSMTDSLEQCRNWYSFHTIRKYFDEVSLNNCGLCENCTNKQLKE